MSPSKEDSAPPKIAIKGFSLSSKSSSSSSSKHSLSLKPNHPPSTLGKRSRGGFGHDDSDSDHEFHSRHNGRHETVTGFAEGGAIKVGEEKKKEQLVIKSLGNRDWRGEMRAKRGKNLLPPEVQKEREAARRSANGERKEGVDVVNSNDGEISWGLTVRKRVRPEEQVEEEGREMDTEKVEVVKEEKKQTADEEALEALLGQRQEKKGPDLIISQNPQSENPHPAPVSEQDAYKRAIALAPDVSTLEDYERVPVEEFGAALLRGMGWKGEKVKGAKEVKRRQNLLGLGAKELKDAEELGAWVQRSDVKRLKPSSGGKSGGGERRPRVHEYNRERERRDERRSEGSYRREREREREDERRDRHRR
ncbi:DExH-box splicing factor binding site-domain-containing protein [Tricladium varicosporioides]|nr:DExH-box splicing factor binding site-domain-containing protein [Hymenoscyphus varicosporioides]